MYVFYVLDVIAHIDWEKTTGFKKCQQFDIVSAFEKKNKCV